MKDQFLYEAAPAVRQEFAEALYARISQAAQGRRPRWGWMGGNRKTIGYAAGFVLLTAIVGACAREILRQRYVQVGEIWVLEGGAERVSRIQFLEDTDSALSLPPEPMSVAQALQTVPYDLRLPGWRPEGFFVVEETLRPPIYPMWGMNLSWENESGEGIFLSSCLCEAEIRAPRGMWEAIEVNGRAAVLLRGGFPRYFTEVPTPGPHGFSELETSWDEDAGLTVIWNQGGARLNLWTLGSYLSAEELIRMAESMGG